jgi:hypothetical protein
VVAQGVNERGAGEVRVSPLAQAEAEVSRRDEDEIAVEAPLRTLPTR